MSNVEKNQKIFDSLEIGEEFKRETPCSISTLVKVSETHYEYSNEALKTSHGFIFKEHNKSNWIITRKLNNVLFNTVNINLI